NGAGAGRASGGRLLYVEFEIRTESQRPRPVAQNATRTGHPIGFKLMRRLLFFVGLLANAFFFVVHHVLLRLMFGLGGVHGFTVFFGAFGADLGSLLALFVDYLLASEQFDEGFF